MNTLIVKVYSYPQIVSRNPGVTHPYCKNNNFIHVMVSPDICPRVLGAPPFAFLETYI